MSGTERTVKSISRGDTLLRLTKTGASDYGSYFRSPSYENLYDYAVSVENTATGESVTVTYPHFTDANQAFGIANAQARGENEDLCALMGVDTDKEGEQWT
jgi:hypothetical protein